MLSTTSPVPDLLSQGLWGTGRGTRLRGSAAWLLPPSTLALSCFICRKGEIKRVILTPVILLPRFWGWTFNAKILIPFWPWKGTVGAGQKFSGAVLFTTD